LRGIASKTVILLLGFTLLVVGGYFASGGKAISSWLNGALAAPADKDELNDTFFAEIVDRQYVEITREDYYLILLDADSGTPNTSHTFATFVKATGKGPTRRMINSRSIPSAGCLHQSILRFSAACPSLILPAPGPIPKPRPVALSSRYELMSSWLPGY
jgi:hypothetical protein